MRDLPPANFSPTSRQLAPTFHQLSHGSIPPQVEKLQSCRSPRPPCRATDHQKKTASERSPPKPVACFQRCSAPENSRRLRQVPRAGMSKWVRCKSLDGSRGAKISQMRGFPMALLFACGKAGDWKYWTGEPLRDAAHGGPSTLAGKTGWNDDCMRNGCANTA